MADLLTEILDYVKSNAPTSNLHVYIIFLIGIGLIFKFIILPAYTYAYIPSQKFFKGVADALEKVSFLEKELKTNGGTSLKDIVNRIESQVKATKVATTEYSLKLEVLYEFLGTGKEPVSFFETDHLGNCTYVSPRIYEITGLGKNGMLGHGWMNAIYEEDRELVFNEWKSCVAHERIFVLEYRFYNRKNKKITRVNAYGVPLRVDGKVTGYFGTIREIEPYNEQM